MSEPNRSRGGGLFGILLLVAVGGTVGTLAVRHVVRDRQMHRNERNATAALKIIVMAEADFRANDRDGNGVNDFWTGDLAGLYTVRNPKGSPVQLIERGIAEADFNPVRPLSNTPIPFHGYYFIALDADDSNSDPLMKFYRQDTGGKPPAGKVHHKTAFGFCAYPRQWGVTGRHAFIANEQNVVYRIEVSGTPPRSWPSDAEFKKSCSLTER